MKSSKLIILFFSMLLLNLLFLNSASADNLLVTPTTLTVNTTANIPTSFNVNLFNNFSFAIFNVTIEAPGYATMQQINSISSNQSINVDLIFATTLQFTENNNIKFKFFYLQDFPPQPIIKDVSITSAGFNPSSVTIMKDDSIRYTNNDTIALNIRSTNPSFDVTIQPSQIHTQLFNTLGTFVVTNPIFGTNNVVTVTNRSNLQYVYNPSFDVFLPIQVTSRFADTTLQLIALQTNFTIGNQNTSEAVLEVKNNGGQTARGVSLSANSPIVFNFNRQNFDVNPGQSIFVIYVLKPNFLTANETNRNYNIELKAQGTNFAQVTTNINVFVPLDSSLPGSNFSVSDLLNLIRLLREELNKINLNGTTQIIIKNSSIPIEVSPETLYQNLRDISEIKGSIVLTDNKIKETLDLLNSLLAQYGALTEDVNSTKEFVEQTKEKQEGNRIIMFVILFTILIGGLIVFIFSNLYKKNQGDFLKGLMGQK